MSGIMIQGTASSVGKSLIAAALCRILSNDGYNVCPFKSQNMSLNSYVTMEGLEMGRAQVLQAQAARIEPSANMNPILLKPTSDRKSQVIIKGRPYKNMDAKDYFDFKIELKDMIEEVYFNLEKKYEFVVIEGAGSPAEINLMDNDIVNMGMAEIANAPVILVADIDKGGVFASIYGTVMLLEEKDRNRIKGIIINKFRGDKKILESGLKKIEDLVNIPVVGVIPYTNLNVDEEDSACDFKSHREGDIDIVIIRLPHISNFTDFDAFKFDEDVAVRFIIEPREIGSADILIIPGSKNTIEDLRWLKQVGFDRVIKNFRGIVFGICGGYQMMGKKIIDKFGVEVIENEEEIGLNIFNTITELELEKTTSNVVGEVLGDKIYGYEIHSGRTVGNENAFVHITSKQDENADYYDGDKIQDRFYGTYIHGIFDSGEFRSSLLNHIRNQKGMEERLSLDLKGKREEELDKLSDVVRENIDMKYIYSILEGDK